MAQDADRQQKIRTLAAEILRLSHDGLLINLRFLDTALARLKGECEEHTALIFLTAKSCIMTRRFF